MIFFIHVISESAYHNYDEKFFHAILRIAMARLRKHGQLFAELFNELFTELFTEWRIYLIYLVK